MKALFTILILIFLSSCSLLKSKETLLCNGSWILRVEVISDIHSDNFGTKTNTFSIEDSIMIFDFLKNGVVKIKNNFGWSTGEWLFRDKDVIQISNNGSKDFYNITTLKSNKLTLSTQDDPMIMKTLLFVNVE